MKSAIVPYQGNSSAVAVKPQQSMAIVPVKKESTNKAEVTAKDIRRNVLMLLRKRQQRDRLEEKYNRLEEQSKSKESVRKEEAKQEKTSFLTKVGSGLKKKAEQLGGNLFGALGDILGIVALDWMSKPENQAILKGIVEGIGHVFKFVDFWVTGSVDNLLSGFANFVGGDTILERVLGFFQMTAGFFGLKYFLKPQSIITDLMKIKKFIMEGGVRKLSIFYKKLQKYGLKKALKFAFPRLSKLLSGIGNIGSKILNGIKKVLGKSGVGNLFKKIGNAIWKSGGGKAAKFIMPVLKKLMKPVTGFLKRIPVVGGLISFGVNLLFGDSLTQSAFKALGGSLGSWIGGGIGSLIPIPPLGTFVGAFLGGVIGDWLGSKFYDMLMKRPAPEPTEAEKLAAKVRRKEAILKNKNSDLTQGEIDARLMEELGITSEELEKSRKFSKEARGEEETTTTTTTTTTGSGEPALDVQANITAILKAAKEMNYTGDMAALLAIAKGESGIRGIEEGKVQSAARAAEIWAMSQQEAQQLLDSGGWRALYNEVYGWSGNSLGNRPGTNDGSDFIGRGFIQITGRHNYKDIGDRIGVDFMNNPELLMDKDIAAKATIAFMQRGGSPKDMESALRAVGGIKESWPKKRGFYKEFKAMGHPYGGQGDSKPKISPKIPAKKSPIIKSMPKRYSIMSEMSMNAVQNRKFARSGGSTLVVKTGGDTYAQYTSIATSPSRVNSSTQMSHKRGL